MLAIIPSLTLADLDKQNKSIPLDVLEQQETTVLYHDLPTSGIFYLDVAMDLHTLPQELLPYVSVFGKALLQVGTAQEHYVQLLQRIGRKTGGISTSDFSLPMQGSHESTAWFMLHGKATPEQVPEMLNIMHDILLTPQFDNQQRLRQMVLESKARYETAIAPSGHSFVSARLHSSFHEAGWFSEQTGGMSYLFFLRQLVHEIDHNWPAVLERLEQIRRLLVNRSAMLCNVTIDQQKWLQCAPHLDAFLAAVPAAPTTRATWSPQYQHHNEGLTIPTQVNYVGKGTNLYQHGYQYHGSAAVITRYLGSTWVRECVRVQGGAYGGFCSFNRHSGILTFLSYRDPNLLATLDAYDQSSTFLRQCDLSERELTRSIIGTISDIDAYQLPDARGYTSMVRYLRQEPDEVRQQVRDEVLATTVADFRAFADVLDLVKEHGRVVLLSSAAVVDQVNSEYPGMLTRVDVV